MTPNSTLSGSARRALRAAAHHLDPVVTIGQAGLTPAVMHEIDVALTAHALIKVRVSSDDRAEREAHLARVCEQLRCEPVQHLGKLLVLWRNREGDEAEAAPPIEDAPRKPGRGPRKALPARDSAARPASQSRRREPGSGYPSRESYSNEPARREGWAPRDRRGAARAGGRGADAWRDDTARGFGDDGGRRAARAGRAPRDRDAGDRAFGSDTRRGRWTGRRDDEADSGFAPRPPRQPRGMTGSTGTQTGQRSRWGERRPREGAAPDASPGGRRRVPAAGGQRDELTGKPRGFAPRGGTRPASRPAATPRTSSAASAKPRTRRRLG